LTVINKGQDGSLARRVDELRAELRQRDRFALARNTGALYEDGRFRLAVWNTMVSLSDRDFVAADERTGALCDGLTQATLAYYFHTSDGTPLTGRWIAFSELPDGRLYASAFQGYTGRRLEKTFGDDLAAFIEAALLAGGSPEALADAAYRFQALPRVAVAVAFWRGDEEFPSSIHVLFDAAARYHLPTDACAILGSTLSSLLIAAKPNIPET
jgi:hypothetical protein